MYMFNVIVHFLGLLSLLVVQGVQRLPARLSLLSCLLHQQVQGHLEDQQGPGEIK